MFNPSDFISLPLFCENSWYLKGRGETTVYKDKADLQCQPHARFMRAKWFCPTTNDRSV